MVILGSSSSGKTSFCSALIVFWNDPNAASFVFRIDLTIDFAAARARPIFGTGGAKPVWFSNIFFPHKSAPENVMEAPVVVQGQSWEQAQQEALRLLAKVGLADRGANYYPISFGQQYSRHCPGAGAATELLSMSSSAFFTERYPLKTI